MTDNETLERGNVKVTGSASGGFSSYYDPEKMSEIVDATPKEEQGKETMNLIPSEVENPEELTENQRRMISAAVLNKDKNTNQIAEEIGKQGRQVRYVLRKKCPKWYSEHFNTGLGADELYTVEDVKGVIESHNGASTKEIADELGCSKPTVKNKLQEIDNLSYETNADGYHSSARVYYVDRGAADVLAEEAGKDKSEFEPPEDVEYPEPDDLESCSEVFEKFDRIEIICGSHAEVSPNQPVGRLSEQILSIIND